MTTYSNPGHIADVVGTTGRIEATWGNAVRDRLVGHFASTSDRDSAFPTPSVGNTVVVDGSPPVQYVYDGTAWRPFDLGTQTYTPTLVQSGAVTKTVTNARYCRRWPYCEVWLYLSITGTGTTANSINAGLPLASANLVDVSEIGSGFYHDNTGSDYTANAIWRTGDTVALRAHSTAGLVGVSPALAAASSDLWIAHFTYPIG